MKLCAGSCRITWSSKGKIANYHPYPPTPWNANPRDVYGTPGPYEDAVQNTPIFEENGPDKFKGIDIMRAVRSFDPCLPCGVHMYLGNGKVLKQKHTPTCICRSGSLTVANESALQVTLEASPDEIYDIELEHSLLKRTRNSRSKIALCWIDTESPPLISWARSDRAKRR